MTRQTKKNKLKHNKVKANKELHNKTEIMQNSSAYTCQTYNNIKDCYIGHIRAILLKMTGREVYDTKMGSQKFSLDLVQEGCTL